jgi:hypothetical protein
MNVFIQVSNHTNASIVTRHLHNKVVLGNMNVFIQILNHTNVSTVTSHLHNKVVLRNMNVFIQVLNHTNELSHTVTSLLRGLTVRFE